MESVRCKVAVVSDIHYAGTAEQARGNNYELNSSAHLLPRKKTKRC